QKTTETVYLISSLTLEELDALGWIKLKRGYWIIESRLHHALDVSLDEDRSRVRNVNAALVLGMFRRLVVSVAPAAIAPVQTPQTRLRGRRSTGHSPSANPPTALECAPLPAAIRPSKRRPGTPQGIGLRQSAKLVETTKMKRRVLNPLLFGINFLDRPCGR